MRSRLWGLCLLNFAFSQARAKSPSVNVALKASFSSGPYLIELL